MFLVVHMRFITSIALATTSADAWLDWYVCTPEIVKTAASQGFLKSMINCLHYAASPGPEICLSQFIAANALDNPYQIPVGDCRNEYYDFLSNVGSNWASKCGGADLTEDDKISYSCAWNALANAMSDFNYYTGLFPGTLCSAAEVRARARNDEYFPAMVLGATKNARVEKSFAACDVCYGEYGFQNYLPSIYSDRLTNPLVYEGCQDPNGPTEACMQSRNMVNSLAQFEACAGYDIFFEGPMCSADQVDVVEAMEPTPFYTIAHCAYEPESPFCYTIGGYMEAIVSATSADCAACYSEFKDEVAALALADTDEVCTSNVLTDECLVYLVDALTHFESCSGKIMGSSGPN